MLTKFSDAINSSPSFWRCTSLAIASKISGSVSFNVRRTPAAVARLMTCAPVRRPCSRRRACRPPANSVDRNTFTIAIARSIDVVLAPSARTFASLCSRARRAVSTSLADAARMPWTLLAAIAMPIPVPQIRMPESTFPSTTSRLTFCGDVGVVDRGIGVRAEVLVLDVQLVEQFPDVALEGDAGVIRSKCHAHGGNSTAGGRVVSEAVVACRHRVATDRRWPGAGPSRPWCPAPERRASDESPPSLSRLDATRQPEPQVGGERATCRR